MALRIEQGPLTELEAYEQVPIGFEVVGRVDLEELKASEGRFIVVRLGVPYLKDYDQDPDSRPSALPRHFQTDNWRLFAAFEADRRVGGAIVAWNSPGCDMLEGRSDLAVVFDLRVAHEARGRAIGRALFSEAAKWAKERGCKELRVETQDVNVGACRFYAAIGCHLHSVELGAYGPDLDEAKLIWSLPL
ncbi:GNAT family N-acetyltransferase [Fimbriimonas ginsengisoli]|uniref:Acetyl-transferase n=1 Tax=Fimbriimonas ginsengisoli Gsoil 348 TaxID=661478 RepID=A0A068NJM3_FIMGI|nr:GNAT family N-acetyltransferase [Fimbriimonas ginsengisoli]AIE83647.1 acetyl-transferase [Fimbriimonas ginsengisoli Gsoil 348]